MICAKCGKLTNIITQTNIPLCGGCFDDYLKEHHGVRVIRRNEKIAKAQEAMKLHCNVIFPDEERCGVRGVKKWCREYFFCEAMKEALEGDEK